MSREDIKRVDKFIKIAERLLITADSLIEKDKVELFAMSHNEELNFSSKKFYLMNLLMD
jgi:hypothetical protein